MEFEILKFGIVEKYLKGINPIPFSPEFKELCRQRYGTEEIYVGIKTNGQLKLILPVSLRREDKIKTAEIPHSHYYAEPIFVETDFDFDLEEVKHGLLKFLNVDAIRFNLVDYRKKIKDRNYPVKFWAVNLKIKDFDSPEDLLKRSVVLRKRNQVKLAQERGYSVKILNLDGLEEFYELYRKHHQDRNFSVRKFEHLKSIMTAFGRSKSGILATYSGNKIIAGLLFVQDGDWLWLIINAADFSYYQVNNYIYWEAIKFAFEHGVTNIDFGGTSISDKGNLHFKKGFGVQVYPIYSPVYFKNIKTRLEYWLERKKWHLKMRYGHILHFK